MAGTKNKKGQLNAEVDRMRQHVEELEHALQVQKKLAFASGIFQRDITVRTLLESVAEGVIVCDQGGTIVFINKQAEKLFGYELEEVTGRLISVLLPEKHIDRHSAHLQKFFASPRIRSMGKGLDLSSRRKDGLEFPVEVSLSYLETEQGRLGLAFVTDITQRKEAEWALKLRNQELDAFAHTVAHDLQASLATIIGFSEILADTYKDLSEPEVEDYLMILARNSRRMSNIIDELLVFASVRKEDVVCTTLNMKMIVDNTILRLGHLIRQYEAEVILPKSFHRSLGYEQWVEEVWYNYITNALKYGGKPPHIEIGSELEGEYVRFWVKDNGEGIGKADQLKLFESFAKLEVPRIQGHGLGLSISKKIIEKLEGKVEVESEIGQGSRFSFYLPRG